MEEEKKDKKKIILTVIAVITLLAAVIGATFAYFTAQTGTGQSASIKADTATTDSLKFEAGKTLTIDATQQNFGKNTGNLSDETTAKATLIANNNTNQASENYNIYLDISENGLVYTTEYKLPELIMQVTGPEGEVKSIPGLDYVTSGTESGFDITEAQGTITIANEYLIEATPSETTKEQAWTIKIVLVNLNSNQQANTEKAFLANVKIQKGELEPHQTIADYVKSQYTETQGENGLYYHDSNLTNGAGDNSYRYAGASDSVNNYVCFGSDEATCPEENKYRIIGVFGEQVKLIKVTATTSALLGTDGAYVSNTTYRWDRVSDYNNTWSHSLLNTVNLNTNYINNIGSTWEEKIATTTWQVGGMELAKLQSPNTVKDTYEVEVGASKTDTPYSAKIGLMYLSDYGYAASQEHWTKALYDYDNATTKANNWMYLGATEWTISRYSDYTNRAFYVGSTGYANYHDVYGAVAVRPVFYLESSITYVSGSGTSTDPIRIS